MLQVFVSFSKHGRTGRRIECFEKEEKGGNKRQLELKLKEWINRITIDHIVLSHDMSMITEIDSKPVNCYNMVYLRSLCIKLKINGYKNKRRDEMLAMLCGRRKIKLVVEAMQYSDDKESPNATGRTVEVGEDTTADNNIPAAEDTSMTPRSPAHHPCTTHTNSANRLFSSPETRSMSRAQARLQAETLQRMAAGPITNKVISSRKPKASTKLTKGTAPPAVTKEGTYCRAINV